MHQNRDNYFHGIIRRFNKIYKIRGTYPLFTYTYTTLTNFVIIIRSKRKKCIFYYYLQTPYSQVNKYIIEIFCGNINQLC